MLLAYQLKQKKTYNHIDICLLFIFYQFYQLNIQ